MCGFLGFFFFVDETKSGRWVRKKNWEVSLLGINATETGGKCVDFAYAGYIMLKKKKVKVKTTAELQPVIIEDKL